MGKTVSIADVADAAGVSISTVSLVMNNRPNVAPDTAKAVWRSVRALGYVPGGESGKKRGPKPGPRRVVRLPQILLLQTGFPPAHFHGDVFGALVHGLTAGAKANQASLQLAHTEDPNEARELLRRAKVDGAIVVGHVSDSQLVDALRRRGCVQVLGALPADGAWDMVTFDAACSARHAIRSLRDRGHQRLAFMDFAHLASAGVDDMFRLEAGKGGCDAHVVSCNQAVHYGGVFPRLNRDVLWPEFRRLISQGPQCTGFFFNGELLTGPFQAFCREEGLSGEAHIDVICASPQGPTLSAAHPAPGVIDIHPDQIGIQAVDQMIWRIRHRHEPHVTRLVAPSRRAPD